MDVWFLTTFVAGFDLNFLHTNQTVNTITMKQQTDEKSQIIFI